VQQQRQQARLVYSLERYSISFDEDHSDSFIGIGRMEREMNGRQNGAPWEKLQYRRISAAAHGPVVVLQKLGANIRIVYSNELVGLFCRRRRRRPSFFIIMAHNNHPTGMFVNQQQLSATDSNMRMVKNGTIRRQIISPSSSPVSACIDEDGSVRDLAVPTTNRSSSTSSDDDGRR
jgi:hypothetical protein